MDVAMGKKNKKKTLETSLMTAWTRRPTCTDKNGLKLALVGQHITVIDRIPLKLCEKIETLYLSNNSLTSLDGISQFANMKDLSISSNNISALRELQHLTSCKKLNNINISDNKITRMPYFRECLLIAFPNIKTIDGKLIHRNKNIENEDMSIAAAISYQMEQLAINELRICILKHWVGLLNCHNELLTVVCGKFK